MNCCNLKTSILIKLGKLLILIIIGILLGMLRLIILNHMNIDNADAMYFQGLLFGLIFGAVWRS